MSSDRMRGLLLESDKDLEVTVKKLGDIGGCRMNIRISADSEGLLQMHSFCDGGLNDEGRKGY